MDADCPSTEEYLRARAEPVLHERMLAHAAKCPRCLLWIEITQEEMEAVSAADRRPSVQRTRTFRVAAAASLLLALAAGGYWIGPWRSGPAGDRAVGAFVLPSGERIVADAGTFSADPGANRHLTLPDGSRARLEGGSALRIVPPVRGVRAHLRIERGAVEVEVPPGKGRFTVGSIAGEVEVLGTRFRAEAFVLKPDIPCLCVEVYQGSVFLKAPSDRILLSAGERGIRVGKRLEKQALGGGPRTVLEAFARLLRPGPSGLELPPERYDQGVFLAGLLFGSRWDAPLDLDASEGDAPATQVAKRILIGMLE